MISLLALASGLLTALALPTAFGAHRFLHLGGLAWIGLMPLVWALRRQKSEHGFSIGFLWGCAYYGISLYWMFIALRVYGEVSPWVSALGLALSVMIEATFTGLAIWLAGFLKRRGLPMALGLPLAWVVQDYLRNFIPFGGFSWSALAYTQHDFRTLLQVLDVTGVYGITFLVVMANVVLAELVVLRRRVLFWPAGVFVALFILAVGYGGWRFKNIQHVENSSERLQVAIVQGNIPQDQKWLEEKIEEIVLRHLVLTRESLVSHPDLVLWPEAAYPAVLPPEIKRISLMEGLPVPLLMGVVTYTGLIPETWPIMTDETDFRLYNSAVLVQPGGTLTARYDKSHLVPMGEYIPLSRWLPFLRQVVPAMGEFTSGSRVELMTLESTSPPRRFGVTICYEDLFPEIARRWTQRGADFLVNLTNDAWYEDSSAVFQHADFSRYRSIENRRALVRATNTGVTAVFGPTGETLATAPLFEEAVLTATVPLSGVRSFYTSFGDIFAWGCVVVVTLLLAMGLRRHSHEGT